MTEPFEDDELAEAAVFLAHASVEHDLPPELEKRLFAEGRAIAAEARTSVPKTTNRASALALDMEPDATPAAPRRSWREWAAWSVAAACFAIAVFEWRASSLERDRRNAAELTPPAAASTEVSLSSPEGTNAAALRWSDDTHSGSMTVRSLAPLPHDTRYQVWLVNEGSAPTPLGFFACEGGCTGLHVPIAAPTPVAHGGRFEVTIAGVQPVSGSERFIARGSFPSAPSR
jgi:hypothetical protein